jgi:hypothetical protein
MNAHDRGPFPSFPDEALHARDTQFSSGASVQGQHICGCGSHSANIGKQPRCVKRSGLIGHPKARNLALTVKTVGPGPAHRP